MRIDHNRVSILGGTGALRRTTGIGALSSAATKTLIRKTLFSLLFASLTGALASLRFYLPFTPVPVTGQVFAVLLSGALLGARFGPLSQLFYIGLGIAGVPWFALGPIGPTGGYLVGFAAAPAVIGSMLEGREAGFGRVFLAMCSGVFVIYALGLTQFSLFTKNALLDSFLLAVLPFVPFDLFKALAAAFVSLAFIRYPRT